MGTRLPRAAIAVAGLLAVGGARVSATVIDVEPVSASPLGSQAFGTLGGKWNPGANTAQGSIVTGSGGATWSIMGGGFVDVSGFDTDHVGATMPITALSVPGFAETDYITLFDDALNVWAAVSGFTNLGMVTDGGVDAGATEASGGGLGDIRIAAWEISTGSTLAHAFEPGNESVFGPGGSIAGDVHIDVSRTWVDDPTDTTADSDYDLYTVFLHELGHSLGLDHSAVSGSVMEPFYGGARRTLHPDDIAGIQAIYGLPATSTPEPSSLLLLGTLGIGAWWRRRRGLNRQVINGFSFRNGSSFPSFRLGTPTPRSFGFAMWRGPSNVKTDPPPSAAEAA